MQPWTIDWKNREMDDLHYLWNSCKRCKLHGFRNKIVFGTGYRDADIMIIGEAPGEVEDQEGLPFVGPSGELLDVMLDVAGIVREQCFITNMVQCRPPDNRDPARDEKAACLERLYKEIYIIDPYLIILVGKVAMQALTKCKSSMDYARGDLVPMSVPGRAPFGKGKVELVYDAMAIYHPAYIMRHDSVDDKTKKWTSDGPANKTVGDLTRADALVSELKKYYSRRKG